MAMGRSRCGLIVSSALHVTTTRATQKSIARDEQQGTNNITWTYGIPCGATHQHRIRCMQRIRSLILPVLQQVNHPVQIDQTQCILQRNTTHTAMLYMCIESRQVKYMHARVRMRGEHTEEADTSEAIRHEGREILGLYTDKGNMSCHSCMWCV